MRTKLTRSCKNKVVAALPEPQNWWGGRLKTKGKQIRFIFSNTLLGNGAGERGMDEDNLRLALNGKTREQTFHQTWYARGIDQYVFKGILNGFVVKLS